MHLINEHIADSMGFEEEMAEKKRLNKLVKRQVIRNLIIIFSGWLLLEI